MRYTLIPHTRTLAATFLSLPRSTATFLPPPKPHRRSLSAPPKPSCAAAEAKLRRRRPTRSLSLLSPVAGSCPLEPDIVEKEMTGRLLRRCKKVVSRGPSSGESSQTSNIPSTPVHPDSHDEHESSDTAEPSRHSHHSGSAPVPHSDDEYWLINDQGATVRRRGRTTCTDLQNLPPGTRVHIEVNNNGIPCNIPESTLLGSYLGVIARDPVLAPLSFTDWRNKGLEPFKKKMLAEVELKFEFPGHVRPWILQAIGARWRNHKSNLKAEYLDSRPIREVMENVPVGVDATQWCHLVNQWSQPDDQARSARNSNNAKRQNCPHTMGRMSSVQKQQQTAIQGRLQLWRINRLHKDGSWSSDNAKQRWAQACELLVAQGLTPEDGNVEANENAFVQVMGPEHPGRVRTQGFGVTPTRFFPQSTTTPGGSSSSGSSFARVAILEEQLHSVQAELRHAQSFQSEVRQFMQQFPMHHQPPDNSHMGGNDGSSND